MKEFVIADLLAHGVEKQRPFAIDNLGILGGRVGSHRQSDRQVFILLYRDTQQRPFFEFAVAHEVAHQWWYSQVGDDQVNTPWMDESLAQYSTLIYEEDTYGEGAAQTILKNVFQMPYDRAKQQNQDEAVGLPVSAYSEEQYVEIVYGKGPLFFDAVRKQIGDDKFFKAMQAYYQRYKYQVATPDDLRQTIDQASGENIDPLYNQWILGK